MAYTIQTSGGTGSTIYYGPNGEVSLYPREGYTTSPTTTSTAPAPTGSISTSTSPVPPDAISTATGIDPNEVAAATYGKIIPIWVGGMPRLGCHIIFGPNFTSSSGITSTSFGVSFGMPANNTGTRELRELRLDGFKVWSIAEGTLLAGLTFRFYPGTETQAADPLVIAAFPGAAVAHKGQACVFIENLPLTNFAGKVPFVSALIADTTLLGDPADGVNLGDALETLAASPYVNLPVADFETDGISERVDAVIVAEKVSFLDLLNRYARLYLWDVVQRDKLKVLERGTVAPDLALDLTHILASDGNPPIMIERSQQTDVPRELDYSWIDIDRDYEINSVTAKRPRSPIAVTASAGKDTIALPSVHTVQEAMSWATLRRFKDELARETISFTATIFGYEIEPGDVVTVDAGFKNYVVRVTESLKGANWTNRVRGEPVLRCALPVSSSPLDGLACVTGAWSLSRNLLSAFSGDRYTEISTAVSRITDQTGNNRHFDDDGGATTRPAITTGGPNNRTCADFDGINDYLDTASDLSTFITNSDGYVVVSLIVDAVTLSDADPQDNHCLLGDAGQKFGIYASNIAVLTLHGFNWDGSADAANKSKDIAIPLLISLRHEGGTLYLRTDNGTDVEVVSGNTSDLTGDLRLAMSAASTNANIKVFEVVTFNCVPTLGTRDALEQDMLTWIGGTIEEPVSDYVPPDSVSVAVAKNTADSATLDFNNVNLSWAQEEFDTNAFHDTGSNTSRITIPSALNGRAVIVGATVTLIDGTAGSDYSLVITKNGSAAYDGMGALWNDTPFNPIGTATTQPIIVATGDYFEALVTTTDTTQKLKADFSSFYIWVVA